MSAPDTQSKPGEAKQESPLVRLLLDLGPLLLFFGINAYFGIFAATAVFMVAITVALILSRMLTGQFAKMPLVTAVFVLLFGGLTLYLQDEIFIKVKPTIIYLLFAGILLGGIAVKRVFLQSLLGEAFDLEAQGWRKLTFRWAWFFIFLAALNEFVWRSFSTDIWVSFKVFGLLPLTLIFAALQVGLLQKHAKSAE